MKPVLQQKEMIMNKILTLLVIICCGSILFAEIPQPNELFHQTYKVPTLFNPNKINVDHTVAFSSSINSNNQSFYQSRYTNSIEYTFNPKLKMNIDLHFINDGTATWSKNFDVEGNGDNENHILPEFSLEYKPTENSKFIFEVQQGGVYRPENRYWWIR
jgi:hypothetical protein